MVDELMSVPFSKNRNPRCWASLTSILLLVVSLNAFAHEKEKGPSLQEVKIWLGRYVFGPEQLTIRWADGLYLDLNHITLAVDGRWHDTVPVFAVRHRAQWLGNRGVIRVEEQHDDGAHWRHELRLEPDTGRIIKVLLANQPGDREQIVRTYQRIQ